MKFVETELFGVVEVVLEPHADTRGWFARTWSRAEFSARGFELEWEQQNLAHNPREGTFRGLHLQRDPYAETKYIRCTRGRLFDVAVDLRRSSNTFRHWTGRVLSADQGNGLLIPRGFGHGYLTLESNTDLLYMTSANFAEEAATGVRVDDPSLDIVLPTQIGLMSDRDRSWPLLTERDDL